MNSKFHKDCEWVNAQISYPDKRYPLLKQVLTKEALKTHIAYRIIHPQFGVLTTIKFDHNKEVYIKDEEEALRKFASA